MNMGRILAAAIVGAVILFIWGYVSNMLLPLGMMGVSTPSNQEALMAPMAADLTERTMFIIPSIPPDDMKDEAKMKAWGEQYKAGPRAFVVYDPTPGVIAMGGKTLGLQFGASLVAALLAALVLGCVKCGYAGRVGVVVAMGLFSWASINLSHWIWYRFPTEHLMGQLIMHGVGWLASGLVMAAIMKHTCCAIGACEAPAPTAAE